MFFPTRFLGSQLMLKPFLLCAAFILATLASLTFVRAPDTMIAWKLALLAGEYGHWLVFPVVLIALWASTVMVGVSRTLTLIFCLMAAVGFLRPAFVAHRIAMTLPTDLRVALGTNISSAPAFDLKRLFFHAATPAARVTTEVFARPEGRELRLDFYQSSSAKDSFQRPRPCVIVIHGGGWDNGDRTQLSAWNSHLVTRGYAVAAISYRLAPQFIWPAQRDDVLAAIDWLKANAAKLEIDPARLVLLGRSAGGQIATAVAYGAHDSAIRGVIALYAPHDMPFAWSVSREDDALNSIKLFRQYFGGAPDIPERRTLYESASGQLLATSDSPPTLLIHGVPDTLAWYRHSERLAVRLQELGVPHYYLQLPWATHAFDFNPHGPAGQLTGYAIDSFLEKVFSAGGPSPRL